MTLRSQWIIDKSEAIASGGMVTAMHPLAADAGAEMLRRGGHAVDAAVAMAFAVGVVEPFMSGVGGIAFLVYRDAATGRITCLDGSSVLPQSIRPEMFEILPDAPPMGLYAWPATRDDANNTGWLAPAVPGMPALMGEIHRRHGRLPWSDALQPAISLAGDGFEVDAYVSAAITGAYDRLARFASSRAIFMRASGGPLRPPVSGAGDMLVQSELAWTLRQIAEYGPDALYGGEVGKRLVGAMEANGGLITEDDLQAHRTLEPKPTALAYREVEVVGQVENTGNATVFEALKILEGFDLTSAGFHTPESVHLLIESLRVAFVDRLRFLGDAELMPVPYRGIVSSAYAETRRREIDPERANPSAEPGDPWAHEPDSSAREAASRSGATGEGQTTHMNVIDGDGNMVSLTSTLGASFGTAAVVPGTGILLNNATMWFDPRPGAVTSIGPGKRILSAASPVVVLKSGKPFATVGAPGGRRVISAVAQVLLNLMEYGRGMQESVSAPRVHSEGSASEVSERFPPELLASLERIGHQVVPRAQNLSASHFARPSGIRIDESTGKLHGGVFQYTPATAIGIE
jgi:gamma-glutamyltranspeptidase / glutathione hydrolase